MWRKWLVIAALLVLPTQVLAAGKRIALVVGINYYQNQSTLVKARAGAKAMAEAFRSNGIEVVEDLTHSDTTNALDLNQSFERFLEQAKTADEVYVYFAGHGLQHNNATYLLASDTPQYDGDAPTNALLLTSWLERLVEANQNAQRIIWLDACRDNPLSKNQYVTPSYLGSPLNNPKAQKGNLIIYSAANGSKVYDNNPLAEQTAQWLKQFPNMPMTELVQEVREDIFKRTKGKQVLEESNTLTRNVCPSQCLNPLALSERQSTVTFSCNDTKICPKGSLTITANPISPLDIRVLMSTRRKFMDADISRGCWNYQNDNWAFYPVANWSDANSLPATMAKCLSYNDAAAVANWYSSQSSTLLYRLPTLEEQQLIATHYKRTVSKEQLERCQKMGNNATCYSDAQLGVYLVRE